MLAYLQGTQVAFFRVIGGGRPSLVSRHELSQVGVELIQLSLTHNWILSCIALSGQLDSQPAIASRNSRNNRWEFTASHRKPLPKALSVNCYSGHTASPLIFNNFLSSIWQRIGSGNARFTTTWYLDSLMAENYFFSGCLRCKLYLIAWESCGYLIAEYTTHRSHISFCFYNWWITCYTKTDTTRYYCCWWFKWAEGFNSRHAAAYNAMFASCFETEESAPSHPQAFKIQGKLPHYFS